MYEIINDMISYAHSAGQVDTSRNLLSWATAGPGGPNFPNVWARFPRTILARIGTGYARRGKLIVAGRTQPYVARWRKAYCARRARGLSGDSGYRPMIFRDASFINKNADGCDTWAPSGDADGDVVEDHNAGGTVERWAILRALAGWGDSSRNRGSPITRDYIMVVRGLAISHNEFPHPVV